YLPEIGTRAGSGREEISPPPESTFDDHRHLSKFTERIVFEDDNDNPTSRLSSLQMNSVLHNDGIWKDKGLGVGSAGLGSTASYLHRYIQIGDDDNSFPTMLSTSSSALDLAKFPRTTTGLRHSGILDSGLNSEWPQYSKPLLERIPTAHALQRTNSLVGYVLTSNAEESLKSALPKLTPSYSSSDIISFSKGPALAIFDGLNDKEHQKSLHSKSDPNPGDICPQFQD
ncbi:hypothetical protein BGZ65_012716, partial [Modicella reniformis]